MPPKIITCASRKGGVGKTAASVHLAAALADLGVRVLVLDLDGQASATSWLGCRPSRALAEALVDGAPLAAAVVRSPAAPVDVIPSAGNFLDQAGRILAAEVGAELVLRRGITTMLEAEPDRWGVLLIDTAPALGVLTVGALAAARYVLVPAEPSTIALAGVRQLVDALEPIRDRLNPDLELAGVLLSRVDRTALSRDVAAALAAAFPGRLMSTVIRDRVAVRESYGHGQPVSVYAPTSDAAADYRAAAVELARRVGTALRATSDSQATLATQAEGEA
jgi:chromosome partitioning protein